MGQINVKPVSRGRLLALSALLLVTAGVSASDTFYRWQDERGNQVNSDRPPPAGTAYEVISTESSMVRRVNTADAPENAAAEAAKEQEKPAGGQTVVTGGQVKIVKNPEVCAQAKENLATLEVAPRVRLRGEDGEYRYLTEDERKEQEKRARDSIAVHCD